MSEGKTVLVIDDEVRICESFAKALSKEGYDVLCYTSGGAAMGRLKAGGVDLVVSDLMMPDKTGLDVLKEMRALGIGTHLIMITGYASIENALETMRLGAVDYLPKPFTLAELKAAIARGLRVAEVDTADLPLAPKGTYEIANHAWARKTDTDEARIGIHPFVLRSCGRVTEIELPLEEDELAQGGTFGKLLADDARVPIRLWCPISGIVTATNAKAVEDLALVAADPYGDGWLLAVRPSNWEQDLKALLSKD